MVNQSGAKVFSGNPIMELGRLLEKMATILRVGIYATSLAAEERNGNVGSM